MSEWKSVRIADVAVRKGLVGGPFGSSLGTKDYVESGIPVIRGVNLGSDGKFDCKEFAFVTPEKFEQDLARNSAQPGDVIFTQRGTLGQVGIVPASPYGRYVVSQSQMRLRVDRELAINDFIYYQFKSPFMIAEIRNRAITTGVPHINLGILGDIKVVLPPLPVQQAIVAILGVLDDKIAVNDGLARTSRKLAEAHFRAAVESYDAYEVELSSAIEFLNRGVPPRYTQDESQLRVLNQKCIRDGRVSFGPSRRTLNDKVPAAKLLRRHDVLVNSTGVGTLGRVARWTKQDSCTVDSHVTIARFDERKVDPVCAGFAMLGLEHEIETLGEGSTGQTELSRGQLSALRITVPSRQRSTQLRSLLDALESYGDAALAESDALAELRDVLLPKLMSGEIRVRDAEKMVEDVT